MARQNRPTAIDQDLTIGTMASKTHTNKGIDTARQQLETLSRVMSAPMNLLHGWKSAAYSL